MAITEGDLVLQSSSVVGIVISKFIFCKLFCCTFCLNQKELKKCHVWENFTLWVKNVWDMQVNIWGGGGHPMFHTVPKIIWISALKPSLSRLGQMLRDTVCQVSGSNMFVNIFKARHIPFASAPAMPGSVFRWSFWLFYGTVETQHILTKSRTV